MLLTSFSGLTISPCSKLDVLSVDIDEPESLLLPPFKSAELYFSSVSASSSSSSSSKNKLKAPLGFSVGIKPNLSYKTSSSSIVATSELFADSSTDDIISLIVNSPFSTEQILLMSTRGYNVDFLSCVKRIIVSIYIGKVCK